MRQRRTKYEVKMTPVGFCFIKTLIIKGRVFFLLGLTDDLALKFFVNSIKAFLVK